MDSQLFLNWSTILGSRLAMGIVLTPDSALGFLATGKAQTPDHTGQSGSLFCKTGQSVDLLFPSAWVALSGIVQAYGSESVLDDLELLLNRLSPATALGKSAPTV